MVEGCNGGFERAAALVELTIIVTAVIEPSAIPDQTCALPARSAAATLVRAKALVLLLAGAPLFAWLSWRPMRETDLWGHLAYGRWIWTHGRLPAHEIFLQWMPDAPLVDTAWLYQLLTYLAYGEDGIVAIQLLFAGLTAAAVVLLGIGLLRRTGQLLPGVVGAMVFVVLEWRQWTNADLPVSGLIRPQLAGSLCFVLLFTVLQMRKPRYGDAVWILPLFALWGNLHGSFVIGLILLTCLVLGRAADLLRRTATLRSIQRDRQIRQLLILLAAGFLGSLVNPYFWDLYGEVLTFNRNPNLAGLVEWRPIHIEQFQGRAAACVALALAIAYRTSPRRVQSAELLLLVGFGGWTLWTSRIIVWAAVPAAWYLALHAHAAWRRSIRRRQLRPLATLIARISVRPSKMLSIVTAVAWMSAICLSPWGLQSLGVQNRPLSDGVSAGTPLGAAAYLREHPPQGQIFNTLEWGDYLLWAGPPDLRVFADSHVHLLPYQVWHDYQRIGSGGSVGPRLLDDYRVQLVVIDRDRQPFLIQRLKLDPEWKLVYEDARARIFSRQ